MCDKQPDFYFVSGEMSSPEVLRCWDARSLKNKQGHDLLLVRVDPPLMRYMPEPIEDVVLAWGNGVGYWLPIRVWPMLVHVLSGTEEVMQTRDVIDQSHLTFIDRGALFQIEEDASAWLG